MTTSRIEEVHANALSVIGKTTRDDLGKVRRLDLDRYDVAVAGSIQGHVAAGSTPLYLSSVLVWTAGPPECELLPDGNAGDPFAGFEVAGLRLMGGGQELTFHRDVEPGAHVVVDITLASADLKTSSSGQLLVLVVERSYADEHGPLVDCRETFLGREPLA